MIKNKKKTHLVFMFSYSPTAWDIERYGLERLVESNFIIEAFDMSLLISTRSASDTPPLQKNYIKKITSYSMLEEEIKKNVSYAIYVDCINGLNGFQWKGRKIFSLFKQYAVDYYIIEIGSLPLMIQAYRPHLVNKIKKLFKFKKLIIYLKWKLGKWVVHFQSVYFHLYQLPKNIFVGNTEILPKYLDKYKLDYTIVRPIHSFDYDRYLYYVRENPSINSQITSQKKTCVFLDQSLWSHSDFGSLVSFRPVTPEKYLTSMNRFFDKIEKELGLTIIIAANPRLSDHDRSQLFCNRKLVKHKTLELVAHSSLVLIHSSTAVSFAVLFNKPILLIKTTEMIDAHGFGNFLNNMEISLKLKAICIDQVNEVNQLKLDDYINWKKDYDDYKYKYVMTKGLENKTICEIVSNEFNNINKDEKHAATIQCTSLGTCQHSFFF